MKKVLALILALILILSLAACSDTVKTDNNTNAPSKKSDEPVTIVLQAGPWVEYADNIERLIALYAKSHPNVTIECNIDGAAFQAQLAAKNYPELFVNVAYGSLSPYVEYLGDLTDNKILWENVESSVWESVTFDGKRYAVPLNIETYGIIYNKDMFTEVGFDEPPKTISEFKELCEALKSIGITPLGFGFKEGWIMSQFLVFPFGSDSEFPSVTDDIKSGKKVLKDTYFYQNYKDFADLCLANCQDKVFEGDYTTQVTLFAAGEVAMITNGDWTAGMITEITPDINMGIMGMPYTDKAEDYKIPVSASNCMGYFKDSAAPEEAIKFIEWLVTTDEGKDWIGNDWKMATPVKNVNGELNVLSQDGMTAVEKGYSCSWGDVHFPGESYASYSIEFQKYILGETDWDTMLDAMSAEIVNYASK